MTDKKPHLAPVPKELPDPPFPASTKANGFKVEFDIRRIKQSKTWLLARPEVRNALLRLWVEVWESVPCGSLDDDDELIAARLEVTDEWMRGHRNQLLRGWYKCSDGRLYHPYINDLVLSMLGRRTMTAERQARHREANKKRHQKAKSNGESRVSNALRRVSNGEEQEQEQEQERLGDKSPKTPTRAREAHTVCDGVAWTEYQQHRRAIRARKLTPASEIRLQTWLADQGPPETQRAIVDQSIRNGWTGLFELKRKRGAAAIDSPGMQAWINGGDPFADDDGNTIEGELDD